jgi:hypothetical protein
MKRMIFRNALWAGLSLLLIAAAISVGQSAGTMLGDAEAQALIRKYQGQPATPLTRIETQNLLKYLIAKSANPDAAPAVSPQTQSGGPSTRVIAPATPQFPVQAVAELKNPKPTRIGIALPKADLGQGFQGPTAGESLRLLESRYLGGPNIEVVTLAALLGSQVEAEAKEKGCDYVVYPAMTQKQSSGMGFLKAAIALSSMTPIGAMAGAAGAATAAASAAAAASGAATVSSQVKAKNEVTFEYHMFSPGNMTPVLENKATAKAKTDGEDVITPLVEAAATSIVDKVSPKN